MFRAGLESHPLSTRQVLQQLSHGAGIRVGVVAVAATGLGVRAGRTQLAPQLARGQRLPQVTPLLLYGLQATCLGNREGSHRGWVRKGWPGGEEVDVSLKRKKNQRKLLLLPH